MTNTDDHSHRFLPDWLKQTRSNWIATGVVLLAAGVSTYSPTDDVIGMGLSMLCVALSLPCFVAAASDGPHIQSQTCTCSGPCLCRVGYYLDRLVTKIKGAISNTSNTP